MLIAIRTVIQEAAVMENSRRPLKIVSESDATLVRLAQSGDRTAFGLLYLRHHEAAWRVANAVTAFSPESAGVVIEAFARVLASPPHRLEGDAVLRPDLLTCVRHVALERAPVRQKAALRGCPKDSRTPPNEIVLTDVEPVVAEAFRGLGEPERTALWLTRIEALTPNEVGAVMDVPSERAAALAVTGHHELCRALAGLFASYGSAWCQEAAPYVAGVREADTERPDLADHVGRCATCGMRRAEAANVSAALRSAIAPSPLLGRPCQRRWLGEVNLGIRPCTVLKRRVLAVLGALLTARLLSGWAKRS